MKTINRYQNWPIRLFEFIEARRTLPFEWGAQDCCMVACSAVLAMTGEDPAAPLFRGKYSNAEEAAVLLAPYGGVEGAAEKVFADFGMKEQGPLFAQRGDIVLRDTAEGAALGVCVGTHAVFAGPKQLTSLLVSECRRSWRVG